MENPFEYRREMDTLAFSPEQKERLAARAAKAAEAKPGAVRRPMRRFVATVAVAAVVVTASCGAMASGFVGNAFDSVFGTAKTQVINKIGKPIGAGATDNGISVTADAIIGDKYNACIVYTIKRTDSKPLGLPASVPVSCLNFENNFGSDLRGGNLFSGGGMHGSSWFTKSKLGANAVQYVENISSDQPLNQGTVHANFKDLGYYDESAKKSVVLYNGEWKFSFHANYEDSSVALPAGQTFTRNSIGFKITEVSVSPVGMRVAYEADREANLSQNTTGKMTSKMEAEMDRYLGVPIVITKKDGSKLDMTTNSGGDIKSGKGKTNCVRSGIFQQIIPSENMKSITVGGVEIPVNAK